MSLWPSLPHGSAPDSRHPKPEAREFEVVRPKTKSRSKPWGPCSGRVFGSFDDMTMNGNIRTGISRVSVYDL